MAPKKPNKSPFGLFMEKMKRSDPGLRSMAISQLVGHCAPLYDSLPQDVRKRLDQLSQLVRNSGLNQIDVNRQLDRFSLKGVDNSEANTSAEVNNNLDDQRSVEKVSASGSHPDHGLHQMRYSVTESLDTKRFKDNSFDSDEETDTFETLEKAIKMTEDMTKESIVCICFNVLVHTFEGNFYPNEVGITEFSLEDGFRRSYTKLISNKVPDNYYATAKKFSESFHKLPINCSHNKDFDDDYKQLFTDIHDLMSSSGIKDDFGRTLIFCKSEDRSGQSDRPQVIGCLKWLDEKYRELGNQSQKSLIYDFIVIDMSDLLFIVIDKYCINSRSKTLCIDHLIHCKFDFYPDMRCAFHSEDENNYCALAVTKRTAYLFLDLLFALPHKPEYGLKSKPTHRPNEPEINSTVVEMVVPVRHIRTKVAYRYQIEAPKEVPNHEKADGLKRLNRTGLGRGRLMQNFNNLQNN